MGIIPFIIDSAASGDLSDTFFRSGQLPSVFTFILTGGVLALLRDTQGIHIDIPIVSTKYSRLYSSLPNKNALCV